MSLGPTKPTPSGKLMVIGTVVAKPGKETILADLLKAIRDHALSDQEPETLSYRLTRRVDAEGNLLPIFVTIDEYATAGGVDLHCASPPCLEFFKALKEQDLLAEEISMVFLDGNVPAVEKALD